MSKKKKSNKEKEVALQIYARVRQLMPWEPKKISLQVIGDKVRNKAGKIVNEYSFRKVFKPASTNEQCFKVIAMPMISNVLKGFNAVLIAYGQTGSGKTFSMLGKPKLKIVGILPRMLEYMCKQNQVDKVELSAVEAFGHHVAKIELFDLYLPHNQTPDWNAKKGSAGLALNKANKVEISDADSAHRQIVYAHAASHFAPTGKNPESSRGHVSFIAQIFQSRGQHENLISYFVMVDCAGSEGETAFTPEFKASVSAEVLMSRRLEAGTINTGLSQLQVIFNQLRSRGSLTKNLGNGLRRVLHPYINSNTYLSVLFTLSPSVNNSKATESTLKFAVTAGMVKVKPVKAKGKTNFASLAGELKAHIEQQERVIEENNDKIEGLQRKIERTKKTIENGKKGIGRKVVTKEVKKIIKKSLGIKKVEKIDPKTGEKYYVEEEVFEEIEEIVKVQVYEDGDGEDPTNLTESKDDEKKDDNNNNNNNKDNVNEVKTMLDDSAAELLVAMDKKTDKNISNEEAKKKIEEKLNSFSMDWQKEAYIKKLKNQKKKTDKKKASKLKKQGSKGLLKLEEKQKQQKEEYNKILKQQEELNKKLANPENLSSEDKANLEEHAMTLYIMQQEQRNAMEQLEQAKQIILDYLKDDGREALIKFFKIKNII